jgi:tRNA(Ile)-lysidine synthase
MAGRQARRKLLLRQAAAFGARLIALAHHQDDQLETFMLRLLRGSGISGLVAMQPLAPPWWRPLLSCRREQILDYARTEQLGWREDGSNSDPAYLRNRLRHQLLPQLQEINPQFSERIADLCGQLRADDDYWQAQVAELLPEMTVSAVDGLRLDRRRLLAQPDAVRQRLLRAALRQVRGDLQLIAAVHLRAIEVLLHAERSQAQLDLPGCWVARRYETLWLREEPAPLLAHYDLPLPDAGELQLPCGRVLQISTVDKEADESRSIVFFAADALAGGLRVRNWLPGDRFEPLGMTGSKKLKRLFADEKIELEERFRTPLLVSGESLLWVVGMRRSRLSQVRMDAAQILRLELL